MAEIEEKPLGDKILKILLGVLLSLITIFLIAFAILNGVSHKGIKESVNSEAAIRVAGDSLLYQKMLADDLELQTQIDSLAAADLRQKDKDAKQDEILAALRAQNKKLAKDQLRLAQINQAVLDSLSSLSSISGNQKVVGKSKKGNGKALTLEESLKKMEKDLAAGLEGKK